MNWSAGTAELKPLSVPTVMSTVPADGAAGEFTVMLVGLVFVKLVTVRLPNATTCTPVKSVPVIVTDVPPAIGPLAGDTPVIAGGAMYVNWSAELVTLAALPLATTTSTVWSDVEVDAGVLAVICVELTTDGLTAAWPPMVTVEELVNPVPVMVIRVPPISGPLFGLTPVTVGAVGGGAVQVNWSAELVFDVPADVTTVTSADAPAVPAGLVAVIDVELFTVKLAAGVEPKSTAVAPVNPVPEIDTDVPPVLTPLDGLTAVTVGACAGVRTYAVTGKFAACVAVVPQSPSNVVHPFPPSLVVNTTRPDEVSVPVASDTPGVLVGVCADNVPAAVIGCW